MIYILYGHIKNTSTTYQSKSINKTSLSRVCFFKTIIIMVLTGVDEDRLFFIELENSLTLP